ncbi:mitochondrial aldehyde dehydrogenase [Scheffersomyces xylosifermentans]|uniref:mitochondrial aldehyde dehydrogenase n=1 Tax=Scheffersomyces xylosifermentans TaxID=1304137 RepID=UPI00315C638C
MQDTVGEVLGSSPDEKSISTVPNIINGKEVITNGLFPVLSHENPHKKLHNFSYIECDKDTLVEITSNAEEGLEEWASKPYPERVSILRQAAAVLEQHRDSFVKSHVEIGGPSWFAQFNVQGVIEQLEEYISQISRPQGVIPQSLTADLALTYKQPIGPVLSIAPWNAPAILGGRSIIAPLAAGCSVILKSSEKSPMLAYLLVDSFLKAGLPPRALQLVHVKPEDNPDFVDKILSTGAIKKLNFTGSTIVGKKIAGTCSKYLVPYLLELGGKNYSIVEKDADLVASSKSVIWSSWSHKGQICMSTDKVFVHESIYDEYKAELLHYAQEIAKDADYAIPQRDPIYTSKIVELVEDALAKGATLLFGDFDRNEAINTNSVKPLILEGVTSEMIINKTESFGPLFTLNRYSDTSNLIRELNSQEFGLKASIWSKNVISALDIAKRIQVGGIHINSSTVHDEPTIPHGGVKSSGVGRFNSSWGIDEFSVTKTITINQ